MIRLAFPDIRSEDVLAAVEVLSSGSIAQGRNVELFESVVSQYLHVKYSVAVSSGTAALHLALLGLSIGKGDEVIVPDFTFPATVNVVELVGATPVFIDIDLTTFNMRLDNLRDAITPKTKAIIPVHLFGNPLNMEHVMALASEFNLSVIEDAACALGAEFKTRKCGTFGTAGCFSFHPRKILTTGEGGMIVTDDAELAKRVRCLRNHGLTQCAMGMECQRVGFNYRLTDFQAAMGVTQIKRIDDIIERRRYLAELYNKQLSDLNKLIICPRSHQNGRTVWQSYVVLLHSSINRNCVISKLRANDIEAGIGTYSVTCQPYYRTKYSNCELLNSCMAFRQSISLPLHTRMNEADIERVSICLKEAITEGAS